MIWSDGRSLETDPEKFAKLNSLGVRHRYPPNSYLFAAGDPSSSVFIVESGLLRLERVTAQGRRVLLELVGDGTMVGELGVLDAAPRSATAVTLESSLILTIPDTTFLEAYHSDSELRTQISRAIIRRVRCITDQLVQASGSGATSRVAMRIVELLHRLSLESSDEPLVLNLPISQEELGQWALLSREGTAKALRELREEGIITTGRNRITVLDKKKLTRIAAQSA